MIIHKLYQKLASLFLPDWKRTYSQCGEDVIADFALRLFGITNPSYLDIGAHHPTNLSNTRLFYGKGGKGVCIEPNPLLCKLIKKHRPKDICLNIGISPDLQNKRLSFYILNDLSLSTFSKQVANTIAEDGHHEITRILEVDCVAVNVIMHNYFESVPDFVSLDTEGLDLPILESFDFSTYRPLLFCIETLSFSNNKKICEIAEFMKSKGYHSYADTFVNTLFIDSSRMEHWLNTWTKAHST